MRAILSEMQELLASQVQAVIAGDVEALNQGTARHEELLADLQDAEPDAPTEEIQELVMAVEREKLKLHSLLQTETARADFLLRLLIGGGPSKADGYPAKTWRQEGRLSRLDRRA